MSCFRSTLAADPKIRNLQDLDTVLAELSLIRHSTAELTAACSREVDDVKSSWQGQMVLTVGKSDMDLAAREKQLATAAETWCREHLAEHLADGERSLKLAHGVVGFKASQAKVEIDDGLDDKKVIERIEKKHGLLTAIAKLLSKAAGVFTLATVVRIKTELNRQAIKAAWEAQPVSRTAFKKLGITVKPGDDQFVLEPAVHQIANPAS